VFRSEALLNLHIKETLLRKKIVCLKELGPGMEVIQLEQKALSMSRTCREVLALEKFKRQRKDIEDKSGKMEITCSQAKI